MKNAITKTTIYFDGEAIPCTIKPSATGKTYYIRCTYGGDEYQQAAWRNDPYTYELLERAYRDRLDDEPVELDPEYMGAFMADFRPRKVKAPAAPADPAKQRRGEVPDKFFAGQQLSIPGGVILFDGTLQKTRIIFDREPAESVKATVKAAGFYYNRDTRSWNKGLTFKAYRAAMALRDELFKVKAA